MKVRAFGAGTPTGACLRHALPTPATHPEEAV